MACPHECLKGKAQIPEEVQIFSLLFSSHPLLLAQLSSQHLCSKDRIQYREKVPTNKLKSHGKDKIQYREKMPA